MSHFDPLFDPVALTQLSEMVAVESSALSSARSRAQGLLDPPSPTLGAFLAWTTAAVGARAVVEVGATGGVGGLWLLRGMTTRGVLTTIEPDLQIHRLSARAYENARVVQRVRTILGEPLDVLPRLSDASYDLLLLREVDADYAQFLSHGLRLLRPGGVLIALRVGEGGPGELKPRRAFVQALVDEERVISVVLPLDRGVALATVLE